MINDTQDDMMQYVMNVANEHDTWLEVIHLFHFSLQI